MSQMENTVSFLYGWNGRYLTAIIKNKDFPVFERRHGTSIHIQVRI